MEGEEEEDIAPLLPKSNQRPTESSIFTRVIRPCAAEFLTTAIFVFAGTTSVQTGNGLAVALVHGMTITVLVYCFGHISGAHINPSVTVAVYVGSSSIHVVLALLYILSQLIGSLAGAALTRAILWFPTQSVHSNQTVYEQIAGGTHHFCPGLSEGQGFLIEVILTFILCQTVLHQAIDRQNPQAAVAIGLAVFVDIAIGGGLTGASMNPARSFGPAVVISDLELNPWSYHYIYWVGPFAGALVAALLYRFCMASERKPLFRRPAVPSNATLNANEC